LKCKEENSDEFEMNCTDLDILANKLEVCIIAKYRSGIVDILYLSHLSITVLIRMNSPV
jgi:hypothetical protein